MLFSGRGGNGIWQEMASGLSDLYQMYGGLGSMEASTTGQYTGWECGDGLVGLVGGMGKRRRHGS